MMSEIVIADAPDEDRYVVDVDGTRAGFVSYQRTGEQIALMHAEVDPPMQRQGVASKLIEFALEDARAGGSRCSRSARLSGTTSSVTRTIWSSFRRTHACDSGCEPRRPVQERFTA